ncbi:hypothetical protein BD779DRAFT_1669314 [Infundibulicybe gibba]|nr:hypothetical protein BD779DRAFT_1669314 [Infundibulicybe gibba]
MSTAPVPRSRLALPFDRSTHYVPMIVFAAASLSLILIINITFTTEDMPSTTNSSRPASTRWSSATSVNNRPPRFSSLSTFSVDAPLPRYSTLEPLNREAADPEEALASPRYSSVFRPEPSYDTIPSTSPTARSTEHQFHLTKKEHNWATLKIISSASSPKQPPKYLGGENIRGTFELMLEKPDSINSVNISIKGRIITCANEGADDGETFVFLNQSIPLWDKMQGDPNSKSYASPSGKLFGRYAWPFSFPFPTSIKNDGDESDTPRSHQIPQTYLERNTTVSVHYELFVFVSRGRLRSDSRIHTSIIYVPHITPEPASALRQAAYLERQLPPCPQVDPIGWHMLPSATLRGLVGQRPTEIECTLSLASPLCYTRGAVVPCHLAVRATLSQDLDLLYHQDAANAMKKRRSITPLTVADDRDMAACVWWPKQEEFSSRETYQRQMYGEIHLPRDLQPSCEFIPFCIEYYVVILPFDSPYFTAENSQAIISQPIRIATVHAPGPIPEPFSTCPPSQTLADLRAQICQDDCMVCLISLPPNHVFMHFCFLTETLTVYRMNYLICK